MIWQTDRTRLQCIPSFVRCGALVQFDLVHPVLCRAYQPRSNYACKTGINIYIIFYLAKFKFILTIRSSSFILLASFGEPVLTLLIIFSQHLLILVETIGVIYYFINQLVQESTHKISVKIVVSYYNNTYFIWRSKDAEVAGSRTVFSGLIGFRSSRSNTSILARYDVLSVTGISSKISYKVRVSERGIKCLYQPWWKFYFFWALPMLALANHHFLDHKRSCPNKLAWYGTHGKKSCLVQSSMGRIPIRSILSSSSNHTSLRFRSIFTLKSNIPDNSITLIGRTWRTSPNATSWYTIQPANDHIPCHECTSSSQCSNAYPHRIRRQTYPLGAGSYALLQRRLPTDQYIR